MHEHKHRKIFKSALVYLSPFNANVTNGQPHLQHLHDVKKKPRTCSIKKVFLKFCAKLTGKQQVFSKLSEIFKNTV